jgi:hypothetical protein
MESLVLVLLSGAGVAMLASTLRRQPRATLRFDDSAFRRSMAALARGRGTRHPAGMRSVLVLNDPQRVAGRRAPARRRSRRTRGGAARPARRGGHGWVLCARPRRAPGARRSAPTGSVAHRRAVVLRALVTAVAIGAVAWVGLGRVGAVLLFLSVLALVVYCVLLASVGSPRPAPRRDASPPPRRAPARPSRAGGRPRWPGRRHPDEDREPAARSA